ncbi:MAG: hypothetical protein K0S37_754 [Microbacterium sp.]|jgi:hypothetical protein|nr:hypothetical protein [Microbacterium sp.]
MIERCSCDALIVTLSPRRAREWRELHRGCVGKDEGESAPDVREHSGSTTEIAWRQAPEGRPDVVLGRRPAGFSLTAAVDT